MVLAYVITLQRISLRVKRRFPGLQHLVDSGLMLESERKIFEIMDSKSPMSKCKSWNAWFGNFGLKIYFRLDATCLGNKHHKSSSKRWIDYIRSYRANDSSRTVGYSQVIWQIFILAETCVSHFEQKRNRILFCRRLGALIGYDTVSVPLVYTQVSKIIVNIDV